MKLKNNGALLFIPNGAPIEEALRRTTHMGVAAHQDDLEIMAHHGILECFGCVERGFFGVTVTDGAGSPRDGLYARYTDGEMRAVRRDEQKKAAVVGEYCALAMLDYPSADVKQADSPGLVSELTALFAASRPKVVYTHNPADKHDTHVAVALRTIQALRALPEDAMPRYLYGCEVWRDLDWLINEDKVALQVDGHENLAAALLGVFDSQIAGGKRYDLATMGRRRANATYYAAHDIDAATGLIFAMDLTPLIVDPGLAINDFIMNHIQRFARDVRARIDKLQ